MGPIYLQFFRWLFIHFNFINVAIITESCQLVVVVRHVSRLAVSQVNIYIFLYSRIFSRYILILIVFGHMISRWLQLPPEVNYSLCKVVTTVFFVNKWGPSLKQTFLEWSLVEQCVSGAGWTVVTQTELSCFWWRHVFTSQIRSVHTDVIRLQLWWHHHCFFMFTV